jgi:hypothetical protein
VWWRSSQCSSLGYSALGAELEWNGEYSNDLCGIVFPPLRIQPPPLYIEVGRVHGGLGELCLWSTCVRVQEGLAVEHVDCGDVVEPKKL